MLTPGSRIVIACELPDISYQHAQTILCSAAVHYLYTCTLDYMADCREMMLATTIVCVPKYRTVRAKIVGWQRKPISLIEHKYM